MSKQNLHGWLPIAAQVLVGGAVLWQVAAIGLAEDKSPKQRGSNAPRAERAINIEPNTSGKDRGNARNSGGGNQVQTAPKFQPNFNREPARVNQPPTNMNPNRVAFLPEKGNKGASNENTSKAPQLDKPVKIQNIPKADQNPSRGNTNKAPQIQPQLKVKIEDRPNIVRPNNPQAISGKGATDVNRDSKIRVNTIRPDLKGLDAATKTDKTPREKPVRLKAGATLSQEHHEQIKVHLDKQDRDLVAKGKHPDRVKVVVPNHVKQQGVERLEKLPREALKIPVAKNGKIDPQLAGKLKIRPAHEVLENRRKNGEFQHLAKLKGGQSFKLDRQFELHRHGDLSRRMNLVAGLQNRGGWKHRHFGPISPIYSSHCKSMWYPGPSFCSPYVWYPNWSSWVDWCWWDTCAPIYDPRPIFCQPMIYDPCSPWVAWQFPTWQPLPYVTCGSWVDVSPVIVNTADVQLLATRFVDPGHPEQELGPRFRVWLRNNSAFDLNQPFNVLLLAATDANAYAGLPEAGIRVTGMRAGETQSIDIRLPYAANKLGRDSSGQAIPFTYLNVLVDSHNELPEAFENNNGATLIRGDILPVDPAAFAAEPGAAQPNGVMHIAGEGLGPEPGQAMVVIGDQEFQAEIVGWFDLGIQIRLPDFALDQATAADLVIVRGDGAAANPLTIEIDPPQSVPMVSALEVAPSPEFPVAPPLPESMN